ncbi:MAG: hypothetical protein QG582_1005 [Candidatus Thermoplasmatota archaeon]|nr:hypothetical protein [Candidatus Thermoplasmatota archaeon]
MTIDCVAPLGLSGGEGITSFSESKRISCVLVSALFAVSLFAGLSSAGNGPDTAVASDSETIAKWSVLVYLVADNNLDEYTETDLLELEVGGSSADVNVLILMDKLYEPAVLMTIEDHERVVLEELGELNMGDPANLRYLVQYSDENCPAEHMVVFFWDHGSGVHGVCVDETMEDGTAGSDWLSHHETMEAIDGYHVDILAADECSIGQMETMYEYYFGGADMDYWVASENYISWRGFSYDEILLRLNEDPTMDERTLSLVIVEEFTELFSVPPYQSEILTSQSVFDMSKVEALGLAVLDMAEVLSADIDSYRSVIQAAQMAAMNPWGARSAGQVDMATFVQYIMDNLDDEDPAATACGDVLDAFAECMIGMGVSKNSDLYGYRGMGILVPPSYSMYTVASAASYELYMGFEFPNIGWWAFLETYWGVV